MRIEPPSTPQPASTVSGIDESAWSEVLRAVDDTYSALIENQTALEARNRELEDLRRFMGSVMASVSDVLLVVSRTGDLQECSASLLRLAERDRDDILEKPIAALFAEADRPRLADALQAVISAKARVDFEADLDRTEGAATLEFSIAPRLDDRGRATGAVLTGRPVGELRQAYAELAKSHDALQQTQAQLVRNEKLASLGRLLAGVAHELNNPISFVYANAHAMERYATKFETYFERVQEGADREELVSLREELKLDREIRNLREAIDGARDGAERVRDIVADLRRLSAEGSGETEEFDLAEAARTAASWVARGAKGELRITFMGLDAAPVAGKPGHIQQVVMNLVQNAVDSMADQEDAALHLDIRQTGDFLTLDVTDTGPGIPADVAPHIFDPFYTTKPVGQGTGLGLAISHKIADEHGGRLLHVPTDEGTCMRLELPVVTIP